MHIVLGAYLLSGAPGYRQAGVHRYAQYLLREIPNAAAHYPEAHFTALISPTAAPKDLSISNFQFSILTASRSTEHPFSRILVEQTETPRVLGELKADLYHGLGFVAPLRTPCPTVVTVFDLSFITQPQAHRPLNRVYLSLFTRWSCRRAARVIAISEWTKRDVVQHFGVAPEKIVAIPLGVDHDHFKPQPPEAIAAFKAQHGIGDHAIFYLGSLEPRKNLPRLIEAFSVLDSQSSIINLQLFVGGSPAWKYDEVFARIRQPGLEDRVRLIGRVSDEDLPKWYSACAVMAYPSLYEGFGLPPLEAMACGAPVVASNVTSLPEVVGDAGITVDPTDVRALAAALHRVLGDDALRAELRAKSLARAAQFTWQRTAERTVEVYRKVVTGDGG
ncbi:MAG: glycosyltransferase family 1 protein [Anaerolineae bacterium]|nr:glycosyltransferase family 4 protein [Candidatus Roseilinea sp.]MDW8449028.1 glycosyltransferase family 1 protein [Anaerolineae bacterium]